MKVFYPLAILSVCLSSLALGSHDDFDSFSEKSNPTVLGQLDTILYALTKQDEEIKAQNYRINQLTTIIRGLQQTIPALNQAQQISRALEETTLRDLINARLDPQLLTSSSSYRITGDDAVFQSGSGKRLMRSGQSVASIFAMGKDGKVSDSDIMRTTPYERLRIFFKIVFGLNDGQAIPERNAGSLVDLTDTVFTFVIGPQRDGKGQNYGETHSSNHFADSSECCGKFFDPSKASAAIPKTSLPQEGERSASEGTGTAGAPLGPIKKFGKIKPKGSITDFLDKCELSKDAPDYARVKALLDACITC